MIHFRVHPKVWQPAGFLPRAFDSIAADVILWLSNPKAAGATVVSTRLDGEVTAEWEVPAKVFIAGGAFKACFSMATLREALPNRVMSLIGEDQSPGEIELAEVLASTPELHVLSESGKLYCWLQSTNEDGKVDIEPVSKHLQRFTSTNTSRKECLVGELIFSALQALRAVALSLTLSLVGGAHSVNGANDSTGIKVPGGVARNTATFEATDKWGHTVTFLVDQSSGDATAICRTVEGKKVAEVNSKARVEGAGTVCNVSFSDVTQLTESELLLSFKTPPVDETDDTPQNPFEVPVKVFPSKRIPGAVKAIKGSQSTTGGDLACEPILGKWICCGSTDRFAFGCTLQKPKGGDPLEVDAESAVGAESKVKTKSDGPGEAETGFRAWFPLFRRSQGKKESGGALNVEVRGQVFMWASWQEEKKRPAPKADINNEVCKLAFHACFLFWLNN